MVLAMLATLTGCAGAEPLYFTPTPTDVPVVASTAIPPTASTGKSTGNDTGNTGRGTGKITGSVGRVETGITDGHARLRQCASMRCGVLAILSEGQQVTILAEVDGWYQVIADGRVGWIAARLVRLVDGK